MFTILILILAGLGAGALAKIIIHFAYLAAKWLFSKIKEFIKEKVGNKVFLCEIGDVVTALQTQAQRNGNVADINAVLAQLDGKDGVLEGDFDAGGKMVDVKIITTNQMDSQITNVINQYPQRHVVLTNNG